MSNAQYHKDIAQWYRKHGRHSLPWRNTNNAYHIYISEVMLQQTQVQTVLDRYYPPFLKRFPTLQTLADAPLDDVLKCWEGLGYYSRARNLHKAAKQSAPTLPNTLETLQALPGIGKNTAHAICTFAYHQPVPVMEANVKRVLHRLLAQEVMSDAELWEAAYQHVDQAEPFNYNQAMMDIGATLCSPKAPKCLICPLAPHCLGKDNAERYPAPKVKKKVPVRTRNIVVFSYNERYFVSPRDTRFLGGLYGFPEYEKDVLPLFSNKEFPLTSLKHFGHVTQKYSHFTLDAEVYYADISSSDIITPNQGGWFSMTELEALPSSKADHKVIALICNHLNA